MPHLKLHKHLAAQSLGVLMIAVLASTGAVRAQAMDGSPQLIPSLGLTKATDSNAGNAQGFGGLALRFPLISYLEAEGGIAYRQDSYSSGALKVRQWPVTGSLWLAPVSSIYFGGGVGWYHTTLDYSGPLHIANSTSDKAGVHIGGGIDVPVAPKLSLDLNGRYIFMTKDKASFDVPTTFNPDFWTTSLGLAISF